MASVAGNSAAIASVVFKPLPVMQTTVVSSGLMRFCAISFFATPAVTPPAVSVKMPSVSASSLMAFTISGSEMSSAQPPDSRISFIAKGPSAGLAIASQGAVVLGFEAREVTLYAMGNRRAAGSLGAKEFHRLVLDPAERDEFLKGFRNFRNQRAPGHGNHHVIRQFPSQLFCDFVAVRLRAFGVI